MIPAFSRKAGVLELWSTGVLSIVCQNAPPLEAGMISLRQRLRPDKMASLKFLSLDERGNGEVEVFWFFTPTFTRHKSGG